MARFPDLPFELQTDIWTLVLPYRGGVQWIEFDGHPQPPEIVNKSLEWNHELFHDKQPDQEAYWTATYQNQEYVRYCRDLGGKGGSLFFQSIYATVPSVFGNSTGLSEDELKQDVSNEVAETKRCRQLSTYTQVSTLLTTCRTSRLAAIEYIRNRTADGAWPLHRSGGPRYRTRPISTWKQQYQQGQDDKMGLTATEKLVPTICGTLDLVVYRLHNASGHPKEILTDAYYQIYSGGYDIEIPFFDRIGIEWHPSWATEEGRKNLCADRIGEVIALAGNLGSVSRQLYWLVDGIPRPHWDQYPPAITAAFSRVIEARKDSVIKWWNRDKLLEDPPDPQAVAWKSRLLEHHDLHQEFEANGRRYYVVLVLADWTNDLHLEEKFRDPAVSWNGPFPGGENLWPEALRAPARVAFESYQDNANNHMWVDQFCGYVLSWEPI